MYRQLQRPTGRVETMQIFKDEALNRILMLPGSLASWLQRRFSA